MKHRLPLVLTAFLAASGSIAQTVETAPDTGANPASETAAAAPENTSELIQSGLNVDVDEYLWRNRLVLVFADTERDPRFVQQMDLIEAFPDALRTRDVVVLTDTDPAAKSAMRKKLRPRGFMLALMGKDGVVYLRKPAPYSVREISASIDKNPLRQQEIRDRRQP
ncbi:DUF4174 domain-containing protein [Shimia marina]|uniref:DUF4174 domain-containing protein n=1 Tax=Shimia marina TaxID=321267 RepID=A0A0P1ER89_9RHOB|nr:DUF4174 domain-containing protein [Shimia marina]CUH52815.1 hypothetical protein SHM7688_02262 [Shimia marina]SFD88259.1 protein of unknown function [Shimia marina]